MIWLCGVSISTKSLITSIVPQSVATTGVDEDDKDEDTDIDYCQNLPLFLDVHKNPSLA